MKKPKLFFSKIEKYKAPSTIFFRSIELKLLKEKLGSLLSARSALDLGCGRGIAAQVVFDQKIDFGLDNDPKTLNQAKKENIYKKTILAEANNIPLADKSLRLVFSNCVVEHLKDLDLTLKEVSRILDNKGFFIFTAPSDNFKKYGFFSRLGLKGISLAYGRAREKKFEHYHTYSLKKWSSLLKEFNFKIVNSYYYIDQRALEFWDFLLIINAPLNLLGPIGQVFRNWIYKTFFKKRIYQYFLKAKTTNSKGAAICIVAQKK